MPHRELAEKIAGELSTDKSIQCVHCESNGLCFSSCADVLQPSCACFLSIIAWATSPVPSIIRNSTGRWGQITAMTAWPYHPDVDGRSGPQEGESHPASLFVKKLLASRRIHNVTGGMGGRDALLAFSEIYLLTSGLTSDDRNSDCKEAQGQAERLLSSWSHCPFSPLHPPVIYITPSFLPRPAHSGTAEIQALIERSLHR